MDPVALVLLDRSDEPRYELDRLDPPSMLASLAPNVYPTDATASRGHLAALGLLVDSCACYRLRGRGPLASAVELLLPLLGE
jgi:hypothetical protein